MPIDGHECNSRLDAGMSAIVLLNSSCQAVVEAEIQPVRSSWYPELDRELGAAETLVVGWRRSGVRSFGTDVLGAIATCGNAFLAARPAVDALFAELAADFTPAAKARLIALLAGLQPPLRAITAMVGSYLTELRAFEASMLGVQGRMTTTVSAVQAAEADIQSVVAGINSQMAALVKQIDTDRQAIADARSAETDGIIETIFGILLAPVTGGASLILAGIGVASIAAAQGEIDGMQTQIAGYQQAIAGDQSALAADQQVVATLNGLTMSTTFVLNDIGGIDTALDALRTDWTLLGGELAGVVDKLTDARVAADLVVSHAWYAAACAEWVPIVDHVDVLVGLPTASSRVQVG